MKPNQAEAAHVQNGAVRGCTDNSSLYCIMAACIIAAHMLPTGEMLDTGRRISVDSTCAAAPLGELTRETGRISGLSPFHYTLGGVVLRKKGS